MELLCVSLWQGEERVRGLQGSDHASASSVGVSSVFWRFRERS